MYCNSVSDLGLIKKGTTKKYTPGKDDWAGIFNNSGDAKLGSHNRLQFVYTKEAEKNIGNDQVLIIQ